MKQIVSNDTDAHRVAIFNLAFPLFFRLTNRFLDQGEGLPPLMSGMGGKLYYVHRGRERRYAGERGLGRGRYYAVCSPMENGVWSDNGTLLGELRAYHSYAGRCLVHMGDSQLDGAAAELHANMDMEGPRRALPPHIAAGAFLSVTVMPLVATEKSRAAGLHGSEWCGSIQTFSLQMSEFEKVLDLRTREALEWVREDFFDIYEGIAQRLRETGPKITREKSRRPENDADLLNVLVAPELGGGQPFNQALGYLMRKYGCDGIVFPSARVDFSAVSGKGGVEHSDGWNFVRLRDEPFAGDDELERIVGRSWLEKVYTGRHTRIEASVKSGKYEIRASGFRERNLARFAAMQKAVTENGEPTFEDMSSQLVSAMDLEPAGPLYISEFVEIMTERHKAQMEQFANLDDQKNRLNAPWMGLISQHYLRHAGRLPPGGQADFFSRVVDACLAD